MQVLPLILELASGDLRKAITYLQTAQRLHAASTPPTPITSMSSGSLRDSGPTLETIADYVSTRDLRSGAKRDDR